MDLKLFDKVKHLYSDIIFKRTYARFQDEEWEQAVERYRQHYLPIAQQVGLEQEFEQAIKLFKKKEILGSMRALATAGYALHLYPEAVYNCSYINFNSWTDFADMLILLMLGVGVGYSIERHTIKNLPRRPFKFVEGDVTIVVEDSKEGWRDAFLTLLNTLQAGIIPKIDYSKIRPAGTPLKTFGGTASGPEPLKFLFDKTIELFTAKPGEYWEPEDLFDLANLIAHAVISGGVRRSACIALVDKEDAYKLKPKDFWKTHPWRAYSNISFTTKPTNWAEYVEYLKTERTGEPGIFNRKAAQKQIKAVGRVPANDSLGANPCFLSWMPLLTDKGYQPIGSLEGQEVKVWSPIDNEYVNGRVFKTGVKHAIRLKLSNNEIMELTPDHRIMAAETLDWIEARDSLGRRILHHSYYEIKPNEYYDRLWLKLGFLQGDGVLTSVISKGGVEIRFSKKDDDVRMVFGNDEEIPARYYYYTREFNEVLKEYGFQFKTLPERSLPTKLPTYDKLKLASFLRGLYSANGSVITHHRIALKTTNKELALQLKELLKKYFDIEAYITTNREHEVEFSNGVYICKESYDVNISRAESIFKFAQEIGFIHKYKQEALKDLIQEKSPKVIAIEDIGYHPVYDFAMEKTHAGVVNGLVCHNCGEVLLRPYQFCNLVEVNASNGDLTTLMKRVKYATVLAILQALDLNYRGVLGAGWKLNAKAEPLLGVSLTGLRMHKHLGHVNDTAKEWLSALRNEAHLVAEEIGKKLNMKFTAVTTVKPSGTASQILGVTPGLHPAHSEFYIRRIRINKNDPLLEELKKLPLHFEEDVYNSQTVVMEFPFYVPNYKPVDVKEQLDYYMMLRKYWTDHNPSATITVKDGEWDYVKEWLEKNYEELIGITFLPEFHSLKQAPYEEISKEEFEKRLKEWKSVFNTEAELEIHLHLPGQTNHTTFACGAGSCEVDEL